MSLKYKKGDVVRIVPDIRRTEDTYGLPDSVINEINNSAVEIIGFNIQHTSYEIEVTTAAGYKDFWYILDSMIAGFATPNSIKNII